MDMRDLSAKARGGVYAEGPSRLLTLVFRIDHCFSRDLQSTIPGDDFV